MAGHAVATAALTSYLDELSARLIGPRGRRSRIVAEIRDGLQDAVDARTARGQDADQALSAAMADFGAPHEIAAAFAPELAIGQARRTVAWYVATGPLVGIWWLIALWPRHARIADALAVIPVRPLIGVAVVTAAALVATTGRAMRWLPEAGPRIALLAVAALAGVVACADLTMLARYAAGFAGAGSGIGFVAVVASVVRMCCTAATLMSAVRIRRRLANRTADARR
jgi:hypothetical protein